MNSQLPPSGWHERESAVGKAAATPRTIAESFGRGLRVSPGPIGEIGAAQPPVTVITPPPVATGRAAAWNVAHGDHGPNESGLPRCARTRHEYITSKSRSISTRCAPMSGDSPTVRE